MKSVIKSRTLLTISSLIVVCLINSFTYARYSGGSGEPNDPYQIATAEDLMLLGESPEDCDKHFVLTTDIDLNPKLPGRRIYDKAIIGFFSGVFDGDGYTISHLTITGISRLGLIGYLDYGAKITNLHLGYVVVNGIGEDVGSLVGISFGTITKSCSTGTVSGLRSVGGMVGSSGVGCHVSRCYSAGMVCGDNNVGGLVGGNWGGSVFNCYSFSSTNGGESIGGLVGSNSSDVTSCYSVGIVIGGNEVGGLVGRGNPDYVSTSFWDIQTSGQTSSAGGEGKATADMQTAESFLEVGWDFIDEIDNGTADIWWIEENQNYPMLREMPIGPRFAPLPTFCPEPKIGATDVIQSPILSWVPGGSGLQYDVYFGEDELTVVNATPESQGIYCGRQEPEMTTYEPCYLQWGKTYYWRIDGINKTDPNNVWKGDVWSFTTATFIVVDDFESYNDLDPEHPESNRIWMKWLDGFDDPINGSVVDSWTVKYLVERIIIHYGIGSMCIFYDNSGPVTNSEVTANVDHLSIGRDWTIEGVAVLSLWLYGDPTNAPEPLYVALSNADGTRGVVYYDNPNAIQVETWTEWRIDLQSFANLGVGLTNIDTISIGFGDKNNPAAGGRGEMWFDDIRLYRSTSEPAP